MFGGYIGMAIARKGTSAGAARGTAQHRAFDRITVHSSAPEAPGGGEVADVRIP